MPGWFGNQSRGEASSITGLHKGRPSQLTPADTCEGPWGKQNLDWMQDEAGGGAACRAGGGRVHRSWGSSQYASAERPRPLDLVFWNPEWGPQARG